MSKTPFMPLWVADFLAKTMDLDAKELGAYMLLLMAMWTRGGSLPSDPKKLQRVARCGRDWPKVWAAIGHYFEDNGDTITNRRLTEELQKVASKREVNAQSGARGGRAKALKEKKQGLANATVSLQQPEPYSEREVREEEPNGSLSSADDDSGPAPFDEIAEAVSAYNAAADASGWPQVRILSKTRRSALKARLRECGGLAGWADALAKARASPHCCGQNDRGWTANFDFLTRQSSFAKLMEGNYDPRNRNHHHAANGPRNRSDPALEQIARLTGLDQAFGNGRA